MSRDTSGIVRWSGSPRSGRGPAARARRSVPRRLRPGLLELEGRRLLSTFTVTSLADTMTGGGPTKGTLRWAVEQADSATAASTIDFDPTLFATPQTITLDGSLLVLSNTTESETITGPAAGVIISGGNQNSVLYINPDVTANLSGLTITGGNASNAGFGGGLLNDGKTTLNDCTIGGNYAGYGAGLDNYGTASLTDCTISGNSAKHYGGGLTNANTEQLSLTDCTISGNSAGGHGGGLNNFSSVNLALTDCTISGNSASQGGGLYNVIAASASLADCTISGNSAAQVGGGLANIGTVTLTDTIVAGNSSASVGSGEISSLGSVSGSDNLLGPGGAVGKLANGVDNNIVLTSLSSLGLADLGSYGGPTQTMALLPGSAAIGAGTAVIGVSTDQRGFALEPGSLDIGASQFQTNLVVNTKIDGTDAPSGDLDLRQAVNLADVLGVAETITFDTSAFATPQTIMLTQGQLDLSSTDGTQAIIGPTAGVTISGGDQSGVFLVDAGVTAKLSGLTITDGNARNANPNGGGLDNQGKTTTLTDCTIGENSAESHGGGVYNEGSGKLALIGCTINGNSAQYGGGLDNNNTSKAGLTLTDCTISGNSAGGHGGGLDNGGNATLNLSNCTIYGNDAETYGGGLNNLGTATLTDTIVAGNKNPTAASDIDGNVSGSDDLIGTGGAGGLTDSNGNQVKVANPGLAPLGSYGGPTQTSALLPGSPAIDKGIVSGGTTDQRGISRPQGSASDIGAFQSQGFTLSPVGGGTPQSATIDTAFASSLSVSVTANDPEEPVADGVISFAAPSGGASAALSSETATIGGNGVASITATANSSIGSYAITASTLGAGAPADFDLANMATPTVAVVDAGGSYDGSAFPATATVAVPGGIAGPSLEGVMPRVAYYAGSSATGTPLSSPPSAAGTYTVIASFPSSADYVPAQSPPVTFHIDPATPTLAVVDAGGIDSGSAFPATATVTGADGTAGSSLEGVMPTLAYYAGSTATGTPLSGAPSAAGTYTVIASFPGSTDYAANQSAPLTFQVDPDTPTLAVSASTGSAAYGQTVTITVTVTAPGGGTPTGTVTITDDGTVLGTPTLDGSGMATLTTSSLAVGPHAIAASYAGDADLAGADSTAAANVSIAQAGSQVVLVPFAVRKHGKIVSLRLEARLEALSSGTAVPTGTVIFEVMKKGKTKMIGTASLSGGMASISPKPNGVLKQSITILYSGDPDFRPSTAATTITSGSLIPTDRSMARLSMRD